MNGNQAHVRMKQFTPRKKKIMAIHGTSPSPLVAKIIDDGTVYTATVTNANAGDFVRLFSDDLEELRLRLRQNNIVENPAPAGIQISKEN